MELVFDCVIPYIQDKDDLNSVSLVSRKYLDIDSLTRKCLTVHVHFAPDPESLSRRFPNLDSLTLKSYSNGFYRGEKCHVPVTSWIQEIAVKFERLKSLSIRNMVVSTSDLKLLAKTRGGSLKSLEIRGCKMFSKDGLMDVARYCKDLRSLCLEYNFIKNDYRGGYRPNGEWLHELALCNTVMESLSFNEPFDTYDMKDVTLLASKCSKSLVSLNVVPHFLIKFKKFFNHAKKLEHFGIGMIKDRDYSGFKFPPKILGLRIQFLREATLLPHLNQLQELDLQCGFIQHRCQCSLFERCPSLEVLVTQDICGDIGLRVIGQFCKKLRKLTHCAQVTQMGLIALAQGCPHLDYLKLKLLDISNEAFECVGTHLKNLRDFRIQLDRERGITYLPLDNGVRAMLMGCSKLERLDIGLCVGGLTDVGLGYIGEYGHNLRSLSLWNTRESDVGLLELSKGCPKLRKLRLSGCSFDEQAIATFVLNINRSLRYVRIDRGPMVSDLVLTRPLVSDELQAFNSFFGMSFLKSKKHLSRNSFFHLVADGSCAESVKVTYTSSGATDDPDTPLVRNLVAKGIRNEELLVLVGSSEKPLEIIVQIAEVESRFTIAVSEFGEIELRGWVKNEVPHLTKVGAFEVDVSLEGNIILCRLVDQGNTISRVTSILGEENVNINSMSVGRPAPRKQAVMVIGIDEKPSEEALKKIAEIPAVEEFVFLAL